MLGYSNEDRLPHDQAVWRDYDLDLVPYPGAPAPGTGGRQVSIDHGDGQIVQTWGEHASWRPGVRWRFGWPPR